MYAYLCSGDVYVLWGFGSPAGCAASPGMRGGIDAKLILMGKRISC
jgi:hypothetical protein